VVPQFWQAGIALVDVDPVGSPGVALLPFTLSVFEAAFACAKANFAVFETRLLNAGHPLQPCCPPVPLHLPPPGHVPAAIWSAATYVATLGDAARLQGEVRSLLSEDGAGLCCIGTTGCVVVLRFRLTGRCWFRALR
jgi:hypothetical protein